MTQSRQLAQGQVVRLTGCGSTGIVGPMVGSGGQGAVYICDVGGRRLALKWYHPNVIQQDSTLRERIARLIALGPPDARYLWPLDGAEIDGCPEFGYVMPLMSGDRRPLKEIVAAPPHRLELTLEARAAACFEVADSFQQLHAEGFCYQDINFGAFFVDPLRGSILICDADNITIDGQLGGVYGTRKFMAPEVVRREAIPSMKTDLYSMAVLFFYIIFGWHPLDGRREAEINTLDSAAERRLYGVDPLFIFDPKNDANGPIVGMHDWIVARWRAMPSGLRDLFTRSFTSGLADPKAGRVVETEWRQAFARLRDAVARCIGCGFEIPVNVETARTPPACVACGKTVPRPTRITIGNYLVAALAGSELYRHHVEPGAEIILAEPVGRIEQHPTNAEILGLHNLTTQPWTGQLRDGHVVPVAPGRTVRVVDGLGVDFGRRRGLVAQGDVIAGGHTVTDVLLSIVGGASGASAIGSSHIARGKPNQDSVAWEQRRLWTYIAVADGHGSAPHYRSDRGSRIAVGTLIALFRELTRDGALREPDALARGVPALAGTLVARWREKVEADVVKDPIPEPAGFRRHTVYGSTCLGAAIGPGLALMVQIGDGDLFASAASGDITPIFEADDTVGEQTYSLCLPNAAEHVKVALFTAPNQLCAPDFVFASTDGFAKSFEDEAKVVNIVRSYRSAVHERGLRSVTAELGTWLTQCSQMGSGDDTSVAIFTAEVDNSEVTAADWQASTARESNGAASDANVRSSAPFLAERKKLPGPMALAGALACGAIGGLFAGIWGVPFASKIVWGTRPTSISSPAPMSPANPPLPDPQKPDVPQRPDIPDVPK